MYRQDQDRQKEQRRSPVWWRMLSVVAIALVFGVLMRATLLLAAPAQQSTPDSGGDDDDYIVKIGVIVSRPLDTVGSWTISNTTETTYTATGETIVEGDLPMGACAAVKSSESEPTVALKIYAKEAEYCSGDDGNDDGGDDSDDDNYNSRYGIVITRPVTTTTGLWVIDGTNYTVTESTVLEGALDTGACVEVKVLTSEPGVAIKIEAKEAYKCNGGDDDDDDGDDDHGDDDHGDYLIRFGILESRPEGKVGPWVVGGETYTATAQTELDLEHGALSVGVCVKVKVYASDPTLAKEIESEHAYKCGGNGNDDDDDNDNDDDDNAKGVVFGVIEELPADLHNGIWAIGGMQFVVSPTTALVDKGGVFTEGVTVKVEFTSNLSDTLFARSIEIKFGHNNPCRQHNHDDDDLARSADDGGGDDDRGEGNRHYGYCPGSEGKTLGIINTRPQGSLLGEWMIGGVPYMTDTSTKFKSGDDFLAGERVKVEYVVISDTLRLATKIKEIGGIGGVNPNHSLIVGYVDAKPTAFVGPWTINEVEFVALSTTTFIERGSIFAVGSYVVVEYEIVNDERVIVRILTYVPPGAGDDNKVGKLESTGGVSVASVDAELQDAEVWTIGGVNYVVSEATQVVMSGDDVAVGATVFVNSYTDNGQRYATMIRTQEGRMYIPHAGK